MISSLRKKGQNTAEYAILIALVVGGVIAMQTFAQRAFQARLHDAGVAMRDQTSDLYGNATRLNTLQYEPYYANTATPTAKREDKVEQYNGYVQAANTTKEMGGFERKEYVGINAEY